MISYLWRGTFTNAQVNALHAEGFNHRLLADDWLDQVSRHSLGWVCAAEGGELIGFVNVPWDGGVHAFIIDTMVSATVRHRGVGTRLVEVAATNARAAGCEWLHVDFEDELRPFYFGSCGFEPTNAGLIAFRLQGAEVLGDRPPFLRPGDQPDVSVRADEDQRVGAVCAGHVPAVIEPARRQGAHDAIADAAITLFLAHGFDDVSVTEIAAARSTCWTTRRRWRARSARASRRDCRPPRCTPSSGFSPGPTGSKLPAGERPARSIPRLSLTPTRTRVPRPVHL